LFHMGAATTGDTGVTSVAVSYRLRYHECRKYTKHREADPPG
jgi:hypothetical protein